MTDPQNAIPRRSLVTVVLPYVGADQDEFIHEVITALSDLIHGEDAVLKPWSVLKDTDTSRLTEGGGTVLFTTATQPASTHHFGERLMVIVQRYTAGPIFWTFGPAFAVTPETAGQVRGQ